MRSMKGLILGMVVLAVCASAGTVRADEHPIRLTGLFGVRAFSSSSSLGTPTDTSLSSAVLLGPRVRRRWSAWLSLEAELPLLLTSSRDDRATVFFTDPRLHGMFELAPIREVRPFVTAGLGLPIALSSDRSRFASDVVPEGYVGIGAWFDRRPGWSLRVDARVPVLPARGDAFVAAELEVFITAYRLAEPKASANAVEVIALDTDGDGLEDQSDQCPNRAEDFDEFDDADGCPDIDDDRDEVLDIADKCKYEPEIWNGFRDHDGCPDDVPEEVLALVGTLEGVVFDRGKTKMRRTAFRALDRVASVLTTYPSVHGRLVGHTDADGTPEADLDLAQARAEAVKYYLVAKGVSEFRLGAVGVGSESPMGEGGEEAASALSRRVEFQLRRRD